jgi:GNAT superfamily N-acetyltransferase
LEGVNVIALLIFVKHNCKWFWQIIEQFNVLMLFVLYSRQMRQTRQRFSRKDLANGYFRLLESKDANQVVDLLKHVTKDEEKFFKPHGFDKKSVNKVLTSGGYMPFGFFINNQLSGYFFLRLFFTKKCFVGRYIKRDYRGMGIGKEMIRFLTDIGSGLGFSVYSTISKDNVSSLKSHQAACRVSVVKELPNNYVLIKINKCQQVV